MRPRDRQTLIIDTVRAQGKAAVGELATMSGASVETIRRDLTSLARSGKLEKIHGGATAPKYSGEGPFAERMQQNGLAKRHIARKALELVSPGDTLLMDTGSTTLVFAEELAAIDDLTVITNSTAIARVISSGNESAKLFLLGGNYNEDNRQTCGMMAIDQLNQFRADLAILTAGAVEAESGMMDYNDDEAQIAKAMLQRAKRKIVLADSSKFDCAAPFVVSRLERLDDLVSEQAPSGSLLQSLKEARVNVIY